MTGSPQEGRRRVEALVRTTSKTFGQIAAETGVAHPSTIAKWSQRYGWRPSPSPGGKNDLRATLRRHIARQISRFDKALRQAPKTPAAKTLAPKPLDSAKVLRDLGGLKKLLDEIDADGRRETDDGADAGGDPGGGGLDLPALRAQIADRYAAFAGDGAAAGLPGEPAAGPGPDPGA
ncbi:hypothetical protein [Methylobacterium sp. Leaf466]|uniref:hypothetical protein n=1 Tax=Methylobacterium sp. Leaf466 TaxID=1736386 RepID=UPI0007000A2D|nr:hypothetical protein [Methylobacterium sp. Leaf466]KQT78527.1 hypothetical protein ASG59_08660 [Methylobacterium sp. Leaf466]